MQGLPGHVRQVRERGAQGGGVQERRDGRREACLRGGRDQGGGAEGSVVVVVVVEGRRLAHRARGGEDGIAQAAEAHQPLRGILGAGHGGGSWGPGHWSN